MGVAIYTCLQTTHHFFTRFFTMTLLYSLLALALIFSGVSSHVAFSPLDFIKYENAKIEKDYSIVLTASPTTLNTTGQWVTVTWTGVSDPTNGDWIGVYTPPTADGDIYPKKHLPVKFRYCSSSLYHLSRGDGSFKFYMVNMRAPYVFGLLRNDIDNPTLVATSNIVKFLNPNEPLQGHLMLTNDPTQIKLMWVTMDTDNPEVRYGLTYGTAIRKTKATTTTYTAADMCGAPATTVGYIEPGQLHTVIMENLVPGKKFSYNFGDDKYGWSKMFNFTVPPLPNQKATTRIIAFGDMGQAQPDLTQTPIKDQQPSLNTTRLIMRDLNHTDIVLHIGDVSYARGCAGIWDAFFDQIQPIATAVPYMVSVGNHERDFPNSGSYFTGTDSGGECGVPYGMRFPMPRPGKDQDWYTFKVGSVQIILMSTEHNFTTGSNQYNWLKDTLSNVDRTITPWLIFSGHRPMYVDSTYNDPPAGDIPVAKELRTHIEPLLMEYKVDLSIWGHHHSYQRTCPVYQEKCTDGAPVNAIIGMAGQGLSQNILPKKPDWLKVIDIHHYGYTRITTNETSLVFEYVRDDDGAVHDTMILTK